MLPSIGDIRPWSDPHVVSVRRLDMRPPSASATSVDQLRADAPSQWRRSLNGRWDFRLFDSPDAVPAAAVTRPVNARGWTKVSVPGNWTLQGVGDLPQYTNVRMPFGGPPPRLPERNPTGVHRRRMTIPAGWTGRQIVLHVGGAESVHAVYVNGTFVGYGTDSRLASEYDITGAVRPCISAPSCAMPASTAPSARSRCVPRSPVCAHPSPVGRSDSRSRRSVGVASAVR